MQICIYQNQTPFNCKLNFKCEPLSMVHLIFIGLKLAPTPPLKDNTISTPIRINESKISLEREGKTSYFLLLNRETMKKLFVLVLLVSCLSAHAQINTHSKRERFLSFFQIKQPFSSLKWIKAAPRLTVPSNANESKSSYWQAATYTSYSGNGRILTSHSFDVNGMLRESRTSFVLKKRQRASAWPLFLYRIR